MWKIVALQWSVGLVVSGVLMWASVPHAVSAFWGVAAVALPSTLFALRLSMGHRSAVGGVATFLTGEFLKVAASLCIFAVVAKTYSPLIWWAMILAAVVTLKSYLLAFFLK